MPRKRPDLNQMSPILIGIQLVNTEETHLKSDLVKIVKTRHKHINIKSVAYFLTHAPND